MLSFFRKGLAKQYFFIYFGGHKGHIEEGFVEEMLWPCALTVSQT